ncbi:hypothetical protein METHPM2_1030001 [Pseudomonas sp. PM2]
MVLDMNTTSGWRRTCGEGACSRDGLTADAYLPDTLTIQLWELACLRRRPDSRPGCWI